jgi:hypothetical protein
MGIPISTEVGSTAAHESFFPNEKGRHYWTKLPPDSRGRSSAGAKNVTQKGAALTGVCSACPLVSRPSAGLVGSQRPSGSHLYLVLPFAEERQCAIAPRCLTS